MTQGGAGHLLIRLTAGHKILAHGVERVVDAVAAAVEEVQREVGLELPAAVQEVEVQGVGLESAEMLQGGLAALVRSIDSEGQREHQNIQQQRGLDVEGPPVAPRHSWKQGCRSGRASNLRGGGSIQPSG